MAPAVRRSPRSGGRRGAGPADPSPSGRDAVQGVERVTQAAQRICL